MFLVMRTLDNPWYCNIIEVIVFPATSRWLQSHIFSMSFFRYVFYNNSVLLLRYHDDSIFDRPVDKAICMTTHVYKWGYLLWTLQCPMTQILSAVRGQCCCSANKTPPLLITNRNKTNIQTKLDGELYYLTI